MCYEYNFLESLLPRKIVRCRSRPNVSGVDSVWCERKGIEEKGKWSHKEQVPIKLRGKRMIDIGNLCESITFGYTREIFKKGQEITECRANKKYHEIYQELKFLMSKIYPEFDYDNICLNHNLKCREHRDKYNVGASIIVGFGDYENGELNVNGVKYDIRYKPLMFNGNELPHYTEDWTGDRWSAVFYKRFNKKKIISFE